MAMKKQLLFFMFVVLAQFIQGDEVLFRVIRDAPAWYSPHRGVISRENSTLILREGEIVRGRSVSYVVREIDGNRYNLNSFTYNNRNYEIQTDVLVPANTSDLFDASWITNFDNNNNTFWVLDGYMRVLLSENRDIFHEVEYVWINAYNSLREMIGIGYITEAWYESADIDSRLKMNQITLHAGGFVKRGFWIKNIIAIDNGYKVTVVDPRFGERFSVDNGYFWNQISFPTDRRSFDLIFIQDNDYLAMYLDTVENHLATFVRVNKVVIDELNNLLKNNRADLSRIIWPRRADGTMDFPPPAVSSNVPAQQVVDESIEITYDIEDQESAVVQNTADRQTMPFWVLFAIIGGVVVIVAVVVKRKG
jgi:hypothetical protein